MPGIVICPYAEHADFDHQKPRSDAYDKSSKTARDRAERVVSGHRVLRALAWFSVRVLWGAGAIPELRPAGAPGAPRDVR